VRSVIAALLTLSSVLAQAPIRGFATAQLDAQRAREQAAYALPSPEQLRAYMHQMAAVPHAAGSAGSRAVAEYAAAEFKRWGYDVAIERFDALLPYPTKRVLETEGFRAKLTEPAIAGDPSTAAKGQIATFNAYAASGNVNAPLVYVNYGTPEDYAQLDALGIDVKGKIVLARYGRVWRGLKPKLAQEHGAVGCLIYSDPRDDGFFMDEPYPKGPMRPSDGAQRGSVMDMALYTGDPLTPGWASEIGGRKLSRDEARSILKIPSLPISWSDALPLLAKLQGPIAPEAWRGALAVTYHVGPSAAKVRLQVEYDWSDKPIYNVIASMIGETEKDQWVLYGNHHDAWVTGASDPVSGAAVLLETARVLGELHAKGWKPRRTIKFALWDGEEFGLIGSTEWVEKHAAELELHAAVYLNTDSSGAGAMTAAGSPMLESFLNEVLHEVNDPTSGKPMFAGSLTPLGSGSDYVPFVHHLGIASLNVGFGAPPGQYHSIYDTVAFFDKFVDTDRKFAVALTKVMSASLLRLADAPQLPFAPSPLAQSIARQLAEVRSLVPQGTKVDFAALDAAAKAYSEAANAFETASQAAIARGSLPTSPNVLMERMERAFLLDDGLPDRPWYRHALYAPGMLTGYAVKTLPGVREALEARNYALANAEAQRLAAALGRATAQVEAATRALTDTR
jgi:N-acetylated-alpha-linked acidic dipeptidase